MLYRQFLFILILHFLHLIIVFLFIYLFFPFAFMHSKKMACWNSAKREFTVFYYGVAALKEAFLCWDGSSLLV